MGTRRPARNALYESSEYREILARVAANVRRAREAKGWNQEECAHKCSEMPTRLLQLIESGKSNLTATTLARLCRGFGVDVVALLAPTAPLPKQKPGRPRKAKSPGESPEK